MSVPKILSKFNNSNSNVTMIITTINTPLGKLITAADDDFLYMISFEDSKNLEKKLRTLCDDHSCNFVEGTNKVIQKLKDELSEYFEGNLKKFSVPVKTIGSDFQKQVWQKLQQMQYGTYQTYGDLAKSLGRSASYSRAVGAACGANAHVLVIPCHRVVASGSKGGFSCGIDRKEWLLEHETKYKIQP